MRDKALYEHAALALVLFYKGVIDMDFVLADMMTPPRVIKPVAEIAQAVEIIEVKYYTTANAKSYHTRDCFAIQRASELIEMTAEEAEASGRKACGNCLAA